MKARKWFMSMSMVELSPSEVPPELQVYHIWIGNVINEELSTI